MVKVIEEYPKPVAQVRCNNCGRLLEYGNADTHYNMSNEMVTQNIVALKRHYIWCPVCGVVRLLRHKYPGQRKEDDMKREERYKHYYNEGYNAGCVKGYEQAIKEACEWLKEEYPKAAAYYEHPDSFIDQFKKAVESGSSGFPNNQEKGGKK